MTPFQVVKEAYLPKENPLSSCTWGYTFRPHRNHNIHTESLFLFDFVGYF